MWKSTNLYISLWNILVSLCSFFSILTALSYLQCPQFDSCTRETKSTVVKYTEQSARTHVKTLGEAFIVVRISAEGVQWNYTWTEQGDTRVHFESMWCQWWNNLNLCLGVNIGATVYWISVIKNIEVCIEIIYILVYLTYALYIIKLKREEYTIICGNFLWWKFNEFFVQMCVCMRHVRTCTHE